MTTEKPYTDRDTLYREYRENGKTQQELADKWDCARATIQYWLDEYDIQVRDRGGGEYDADYRDKETLERLYWEEGLSFSEMAERLDCAIYTVQRWVDKYNIDTRQAPQDPNRVPYHGFRETGEFVGAEYETVQSRIDGTLYNIAIHRLIAVAHGLLEPEEYWNEDIVIHHKSDHGLDNRPGNLKRMTRGNHTAEHKVWEYREEVE